MAVTEDALLAALQSDVRRTGGKIDFYGSIGDFVRSNALESEVVGQVNLLKQQ
jgi:hypothetical protein